MDRLATRKDPLLNTESYQYDLAGNLSQFTDRRGKLTTFNYDGLNRRTFAGFGTQAGPTYESTITYNYDAGNRLTSVVDSVSGSISRNYDGLNHLTSETTPQGSVSYVYDAAGRRATMTVAGQPVVNYSYDTANRLTQVTQGTSTVSFGYDAAGRRASLTLPNSIVVSYAFDAASELTSLAYQLGGSTLGNLSYSYDNNGRRASTGGSFARTGLPLAISTTAYNAANQLTQWGTATLTYDANGNMTSSGTDGYTWDARNRLVSTLSGAAFQYDSFGRRVSKTVSGATTSFLYDGANLVQEVMGGTPTANLLVGGVDEYFARTDSAGSRSFLTDALGSTLALADSAGMLQTQYTYEPFGNTTLSGPATTNSFAYTGRELDATGLYFYRARYYNPTLQRFISEDPFRFLAGDVNFYAYVFQSPANYTDPLGLKCHCTYSQSTGHLKCVDDETGDTVVEADGYAGNGEGRNNPSMQDVPFMGPLPTGVYNMGPTVNSPHTGPVTIVLRHQGGGSNFPPTRSPDSFRIHGPNPAHPDTSSKGCIVVPKKVREAISQECGDGSDLTVDP